MPVIGPDSSDYFASVADLADYLHLPAFTGDELRHAQLAVRLASGVLRTRTGQTFTSGTTTVMLPATDSQWLPLPPFGVTEVTAVSLDGTAITDHTRVGGRLFRYGGWASCWEGAPMVTVTYSYDGQIPEFVVGAALAVAADLFENPRGLTSESIDDYTWRASDSERGSAAQEAVAQAVRAFRPRPLSVQLG